MKSARFAMKRDRIRDPRHWNFGGVRHSGRRPRGHAAWSLHHSRVEPHETVCYNPDIKRQPQGCSMSG
jgi:hypothetical protein